jgi:septum site-determining protein MinD
MVRAIVITSGKGGVGKTTVTANIGAALALRERKVALIDTDIGLRNLDVVMGLENRVVYHLLDVVKGTCHLDQALVRDKRLQKLYMLAASQHHLKEDLRQEDIKEVVQRLAEDGFDYVLLDSPAGIETGFRNAASAASEAIVVTNPEVSAIRDADRVIGLLSSMSVPCKLVLNRYDRSRARTGRMLESEDVKEILGVELLGVVPEDRDVLGASNVGVPVAIDGKGGAKKAFTLIAGRIEGEQTEDTTEGKGIWNRIKELLS